MTSFSATPAPAEELIDLIYAALLGERPWQSFLDCLAGGVPGGKALLFAQGFGANPEFSALHVGMTDTALQAYANYFAARNPWMQAVEATAPGKSVVSHRLYPPHLLKKSEFYNDFLRPNNVEASAGLLIERKADVQFSLTILSDQRSFEAIDKQAETFDRLSPHLRRAARFYMGDGSLKLANELGTSLLNAVDIGVLLIGNGPRLKLATKSAHEIDAANGLFTISPVGCLRLHAPGAQDCIINMLRRNYEGPKIAKIVHGGMHLTMLRIEREGLSLLLQGPSVVVIVEPDYHHRAVRQPEQLRRQYGLTSAELRVLVGLLHGLSLPEIAQQAGVSHETLRSQQRRLFERLDVRSQIQLLNRIYADGRVVT